MARSTQDFQAYGPYLRYETQSLVSPPRRQSTMRLYPHLRFPTTMDGKAQCVYTLICVSPPRRTAKHNVCPCLLRHCTVIAVSEPNHHTDRARRLTTPPSPRPPLLSEHLSGLSVLVWHCTWSLNPITEGLPCFLFLASLSSPSLPGVCCSF